ncbi:MAG: hypothetical protein KY454_00960 [Actinobacteria bacterium]|nr:hypothetical protein [Actinomycetota bacterium]MBW3650576.1 hypothetical protein [Actinomycetota bacterium]
MAVRLHRRTHFLSFEQSRRSAIRGAWFGFAVGLVIFIGFLISVGLGSAREAIGTFIVIVSFATAAGSGIAAHPLNSFQDVEQPESKRRLLMLLAGIWAAGFAGVVIGAYVGGATNG